MKIRQIALALGGVALLACPPKGPPLTKAECRQLLLHQQEILSIDLQGEDMREFEASSAASFDNEVDDCVQGRTWTRVGFGCIMAARTQDEVRFCTNRN